MQVYTIEPHISSCRARVPDTSPLSFSPSSDWRLSWLLRPGTYSHTHNPGPRPKFGEFVLCLDASCDPASARAATAPHQARPLWRCVPSPLQAHDRQSTISSPHAWPPNNYPSSVHPSLPRPAMCIPRPWPCAFIGALVSCAASMEGKGWGTHRTGIIPVPSQGAFTLPQATRGSPKL